MHQPHVIVILFSSDVKLTPVPGTIILIIFPDKIAFEFVAAVPLFNVACFVVIFVFMVVIFPSIFDLSYASIPVTIILFSSDVKLIPVPGTIFLIIFPDKIAFEFVAVVPLLSVACLVVIFVLMVVVFPYIYIYIFGLSYASNPCCSYNIGC